MVDDDNQQQDFVPSNDTIVVVDFRVEAVEMPGGAGCLTAFLPMIFKIGFQKTVIDDSNSINWCIFIF
jgi:hypothetical protein